MADVFISYSKTRRADAVELAGKLSDLGYNVWWDTRLLPTGLFATVIDRELDDAKAVVVIWSPESVRSKWVRSEAAHADRLEKLVNTHTAELNDPASQIPKPFNQTHSVAAGEIHTIVAALDNLGVPRSGGGGPAAPAGVATDSVADGDDRLFDEVGKANTAEAYEYYLAELPQGRHVLIARFRLKMLRGSGLAPAPPPEDPAFLPDVQATIKPPLGEDLKHRDKAMDEARAKLMAAQRELKHQRAEPAEGRSLEQISRRGKKALNKDGFPVSSTQIEMRAEGTHGGQPKANARQVGTTTRKAAFRPLKRVSVLLALACVVSATIWFVYNEDMLRREANVVKRQKLLDVIIASTNGPELSEVMKKNIAATLQSWGYVRFSVATVGKRVLKPGNKDAFKDCETSEKCPEMVVVPAGEFFMGS
jgi:hypothetical protein